MQNITFKIVEHGSSLYKSAVTLREVLLRKPFGLVFLPEELEREKDHIHIVGVIGDEAMDGEVIATAVLVPEQNICKIQRVAVKQCAQDQGIGTKMLEFCESQAKLLGFCAIYCHARDLAVPFYLKNNYEPDGDYFEEDTILHLTMRKNI